MKESRRHRWVPCRGVLSVCRDCGREVMTSHIKGGGFGLCPGKASEHQNVLALMELGPQDIGHRSPGDYFVACVGCGTMIGLEMLAHHNSETGKLTGWIFACEKCRPTLADSKVIFTPKEAPGEQEG